MNYAPIAVLFFTVLLHAEEAIPEAPPPRPVRPPAGDSRPAPRPEPRPAPADQQTPIATPVVPLNEPPAPVEYPRKLMLVEPEEVALLLRLPDPGFTLLDCRDDDAYAEAHLKGALQVTSDTFQDPENPPFYLPKREAVAQMAADLGLRADRRIILYDRDDGRLAARVWFVLHAYGHDNVTILNGGVGRWLAKGFGMTQAETPAPPHGTFEPAAALRGVAAFTDLPRFRLRVHVLGQLPATTLLDARSYREYTGEDTRAKHSGHIPGAAHMEWSALMSGEEKARVWRSAPELHALLWMAGVRKEEAVCIYDQSGGRSAHLFFSLYLMGYDKVLNYTGGWREYGNRPDVELEK